MQLGNTGHSQVVNMGKPVSNISYRLIFFNTIIIIPFFVFSSIEEKMNNSLITSTANTNLTNDTNTVLSTKSNRMATAIPPSPLKLLRDDSVDGTLSPVSSKSTGTDTDTDTRKKVSLLFTGGSVRDFFCHSRFYVKSILENRKVTKMPFSTFQGV